MPTHLCAVKRARRDREELAAISGVTIAESDEPLTINLYFRPLRDNSATKDVANDIAFHFRITIPAKYPFHPPSFKWISRPAGVAGHTPFLGPNGDVSISALSQWTPASSLSNVLISLFPSETLAAQCCSVTSHIWLMGEGRDASSRVLTDPQVLHCLAEYLLRNDPVSAHSLHQTCRAAASAVQQAVSSLSVVAQHVDVVHAVHTFSALSHLRCTQCALTCQSVLQIDPKVRLMSSLRSLAVIRCSVECLFGAGGLFPALKALPNLEEFAFEPATSMLWALYDNSEQTEFAKNPFGDDQVLSLPDDVPRPVPAEWSSIWVGLASVTQLKTLKVTAPLCDMAYAPRDASRQGWSAAACIVHHAFSDSCLSSMPCLRDLQVDLQHVNIRTARPGDALQPAENGPSASDDFCAWDLPTCDLKTFCLSGVALGDRQLNHQQTTKDFWGSLDHLRIGHTAVSDDLQATALKLLVYLAKNVKSLDVASLEELLSKLASNPMSPVSYVTLSKLESLSTTFVGKVADVQHLTRLELRSCKSYINLNLVAESLPQLRILKGLPFKPGTDHRFYWPLRQCVKLEKLVTLPGPPGAASSIQSVLGHGVHVHVPVWAEECPLSQGVFRRGFFPAHRPMLSSFDPSSSSDVITIAPASPSTDTGGAAYHGYALGRMRSRSPVPHTGDSPSGHTSDPIGRTVANRPAEASATAGKAPVAEDFVAALPVAEAFYPEALPAVPASVFQGAAAADGATQATSEAEEAAFVSAGSTSNTMLGDSSAAAGWQEPSHLCPTAYQGLVAGVARWAAGFLRRSSSQAAGQADVATAQGLQHSRLRIARSRRGAVAWSDTQSWPSSALNTRQQHGDPCHYIDSAELHDQTKTAGSEGGDPCSPSPTTVYTSAAEGEMFNESDMDSTSDNSQMSNGADRFVASLADPSTQHARGSARCHPGQSSASALHEEVNLGAPADAQYHAQYMCAAASNPTSGRLITAIDAASVHCSEHARRQNADGAPRGTSRLGFPPVSANVAGPNRANIALHNLNALVTGVFQDSPEEAELHQRTSSEGNERTHKRHASENAASLLHTASAARTSAAAPAWPTDQREEGGRDARWSTHMEAVDQPFNMYAPSPISMLEAMLADQPGTQQDATASPHGISRGTGRNADDTSAQQTGVRELWGYRSMQHQSVASSFAVASGSSGPTGLNGPDEGHHCLAGRIPGSGRWQPRQDGSDSDSDPNGQLSAERRRLSTLAIRRSVHGDLRRRPAAREALRQTLGSGPQVARSLLIFGAESTPNGISETPRKTHAQQSERMSIMSIDASRLPTDALSSACVRDQGTPRTLLVLELPLCPQGHRPSLVAQINAQASPQFEQLGPYLFRIGCCKTCRLQIPSLIDLSVDDVSGTCTDTILVVSPDLSQAIARSTMQVCKRPRSAMHSVGVTQTSEQFVVKQVHKCGFGTDQLETVDSQVAHIAWISCWVPTEPALESPTRNDVQALARAYSVAPPPIGDHPHGRAAARLGGTRATASPACRLCCNRMRLVVTLPCNGSVVCEAQRCSDILQTFKCHLHPQEIQCSWTSMAVEAGRSSSEA
eukprot:jgi/Ulvmu1/10589/UM065_0043.1